SPGKPGNPPPGKPNPPPPAISERYSASPTHTGPSMMPYPPLFWLKSSAGGTPPIFCACAPVNGEPKGPGGHSGWPPPDVGGLEPKPPVDGSGGRPVPAPAPPTPGVPPKVPPPSTPVPAP